MKSVDYKRLVRTLRQQFDLDCIDASECADLVLWGMMTEDKLMHHMRESAKDDDNN